MVVDWEQSVGKALVRDPDRPVNNRARVLTKTEVIVLNSCEELEQECVTHYTERGV